MAELDFEQLGDEDLVRRFQGRGPGDNRAFRELFRRYQKLAWRVCYGFVHNARDAEDLTQDVFLKVYRGLDTFQSRSSFKTWLYRIAITTGQNELRRRQRRPKLGDTPMDDLAERMPSKAAESKIVAWAPSEPMARALASLSPEAFEILNLKDVQQLTYQEIAEIVDIGVSAAKMRVQRARIALQKAYMQALESSPTREAPGMGGR